MLWLISGKWLSFQTLLFVFRILKGDFLVMRKKLRLLNFGLMLGLVVIVMTACKSSDTATTIPQAAPTAIAQVVTVTVAAAPAAASGVSSLGRRGTLASLAALGEPEFRKLFIGQATSVVGSMFRVVAL
ncbi:MAG: hypothetical protein WCS37_07110, partial [Chloroflexota bacterium]